jgi:hypothetical protein
MFRLPPLGMIQYQHWQSKLSSLLPFVLPLPPHAPMLLLIQAALLPPFNELDVLPVIGARPLISPSWGGSQVLLS